MIKNNKKKTQKGQRDSIVDKAPTLHVVNLGSIPGNPKPFSVETGVILEHLCCGPQTETHTYENKTKK